MAQALTLLTGRWQDYLALCKPRIVALIVFTAIVGMFLSTPGMIPLDLLFFASVGIWLAAASAAVINQLVDQKIDSGAVVEDVELGSQG